MKQLDTFLPTELNQLLIEHFPREVIEPYLAAKIWIYGYKPVHGFENTHVINKKGM